MVNPPKPLVTERYRGELGDLRWLAERIRSTNLELHTDGQVRHVAANWKEATQQWHDSGEATENGKPLIAVQQPGEATPALREGSETDVTCSQPDPPPPMEVRRP